MCPAKYYDILKDSSNPFNVRVKMALYALEFNISAAAREFGTTRDTVRYWKSQYEKYGTKGLDNKSKAPHRIPHKTPKHIEEQVLQRRDKLPSWGPVRIKEDFQIPVSTSAIYRILKQNGRIKKFRKKHKRQKDLRLIKMQMKSFQKIQVDVKELSDIPKYYRFMYLYDLPRYQFTARDVKSGMLYIAYARKHDCINAANFLTLLAEHLQNHGIDLNHVTIQTDNGAEFVGSWKTKKQAVFTYLTEKIFHMKHDRIPPGRCTYNSDVETSHLRIERDFYDLEEFSSDDLLSIKAFTYLLYFNLIRRNKAKFNKTSYEIVRGDFPGIKTTICAFNPVVLDNLGLYYSKHIPSQGCGKSVDHVPKLTNSYKK
ncbi:MAG: helix-turn-helix domain-containing protein [Candidatus Saganbacteria bacterium]|nr:helix-turn-helix domain-containing protein [Candidatus Saganbacteria bacterium]